MKIIKYIILPSIVLLTMIYAQSLEEHTLDCDAGHAEACYNAAKILTSKTYKQKGLDAHKSSQKVMSLYKKSCLLGYAKGCTTYAMSYPVDTKKDLNKSSRYYFQKGCDGGDITACTLLKMMPEGI